MSSETILARGIRRFLLLLVALPLAMGAAFAQEDERDEPIEEIVTVGSQIKGATISEALAVSIVTSTDIEALGVDSGDELLQFMAEQGSNFFSESENISGGVNSARGDIGAFNLRNIGTGNTLVLLNGRRMVNAASYQTEEVGGSFVPVNTVNSQSLPVFGLERVEILRDGASAIYGADAVAGVVNYVMKTDFDGLSIRAKYADFEGLPRNDETLTVEWGNTFNDGRTNLSVFGSFYHRDRVNSQDDPKWADSDYRRLLPADSPWGGTVTSFRNSSESSEFGQFDIISSIGSTHSLRTSGTVDSSGEFETFPVGDSRCQWDIGYGTCAWADRAASAGGGTYRYNNNDDRDLYSDLDRANVFVFLNHDFGNGIESFTEASAYLSATTTIRQAAAKLTSDPPAKFRIAADNYWNPFGPCGSPNRLTDPVIMADVPCTGLEMEIDTYRWTAAKRIVDNDGETYRLLQGFRGQMGNWDWEAAGLWSRATKDDVTRKRVSNTLMQEALNDPTPNAYNPWSGPEGTNIERALIDVRRDNETELTSVDFKMSQTELFEMPAGPVGILVGAEYREESFIDDRDPRLDGQIQYTDVNGITFPFNSDVLNSSPSADSKGSRDVVSVFTELQVPLFSNFDVQLAARYEDFSDIGDTTVGKVAFGWRIFEPLLLRGSWSEAYRVPNLVTVNETGVARSNTNDDFVCSYVEDVTGHDLGSCSYGMQRLAEGSDNLIPEQSTNTSLGFVFDINEYVTVTMDWWEIEKDDTIGLFGEENHTALDLLNRLQEGVANCGTATGNPQVVRNDTSDLDADDIDAFIAAGVCPVGRVSQINDIYENFSTRKVNGHDIGVYINKDTSAGTFDFRYVAAFLDKYNQLPSSQAQLLLDAQEDGIVPLTVPVEGFADLVRMDGNVRSKQTAKLSWRRNAWGASITGIYLSDFYQSSLGIRDGVRWVLPAMRTYNASVDYRFKTFNDSDARLQLGVVNLKDERAPLADDSFGYAADVHTDLPRSYYLDLRLDF